MYSNLVKAEKALLVAMINDRADEVSFEELEALVISAGAIPSGRIVQKKQSNAATLFGKGKIEEIKEYIKAFDIDVLVCDNELSGIQMRNLSDETGIKVLDRSSLILDIFALRATSTEGKLQVELAQAKYNMPRLIGVEGRMSKYGGGIGMRGPGEKKLESDRRVLRKNVDDLQKQIDSLKKQRDLRRSKRGKNSEKTVALVGYTNAGKSTLMNSLQKSQVTAEDKLFATLDPVTRKVFVDETCHFLLTDTVGFISRLPHEFIDAFASTLEEAKQADLLLHVIDASDKELALHYDTVMDVLSRLGISTDNVINVYNKTDLCVDSFVMPSAGDFIKMSALDNWDVSNLKEKIIERLFGSGS